jgi:putative transposase
MEKRKWSKEEKLAILKEVKEHGREVTLRKHGVYTSTYYSWRKKYLLEGDSAFEGSTKKDKAYVRRLEDELGLAKQLIAEKDMELALKDELLKKKYPWARKKT